MNKIEKQIKTYLSGKYNTAVKIRSVLSIGGGCINSASRLETSVGTFFLKWNNHCASDTFLREAEGLQELGKVENPFLKIPDVIFAKEVDDTPGFILLEYLLPLSAGKTGDEDLGRGLALIHQKTADKFGFYKNNYCGTTNQDNNWNSNWIDFFGQQRLWLMVSLIREEHGFDLNQINLFEKLIQKLPELIPAGSKPVLIHGDLWSGNYMFTSVGPALIDPAAYYADREMEMGIMTLFGGFSQRFWNGYNEIYPLSYDWEERNKLYRLYHILNHYYLFGGGYGQQAILVAQRYV